MTTYTALFRGLNVGGRNRVKMAELKSCFEAAGFANVKTYIQSGNVLFSSDEAEKPLRMKIIKAFETAFGFASPAVLRTAAELAEIVERCPFTEEAISKAANEEFETFYVAFFPQPPDAPVMEKLLALKANGEDYVLFGRDLFILLDRSIRDSKLGGYVSRQNATVRNWNTVKKLYALSKGLQA